LFFVGAFLLLNGAAQMVRADPGTLFVSPDGAETACAQSAPCTLQTALTQATLGDTLFLAQGTYTGAGGAVLTLTKSLHLYGGWDGAPAPFVRDPETYTTTLDGQGQRRVVYVAEDVNATLEGLHLTHGWTAEKGGGVFTALGSHTTLDGCHIAHNRAASHGGGIYLRGDATLVSNEICHNRAQGNGGGVILILNADTALTGNRIHDNAAYWGGGVQTYKSSATLTRNDIYSNTAEHDGSGGGLNINETDDHCIALIGNRVYSNTAQWGGGVIVGNCTVTMTGNLFYANAAVQGAGVWFASSQGTLVNNMVVDNRAESAVSGAAGLQVAGSDLRVLHTTIARNRGGRVGGLLLTNFEAEHSSVAMTNTIIVGHTVGIEAGFDDVATLEGTLWGAEEWANAVDWSGTVVTGTVNVWGAPRFADPDGGDYHILASSAAAGAGVDIGVSSDFDDDLRPAPEGTLPDLGADEVSQRSVYLPLIVK
jgi:hypothetical protein